MDLNSLSLNGLGLGEMRSRDIPVGVVWVTPTNVTPGTTGSWQDVDSVLIPDGAEAALVRIYHTDTTSPHNHAFGVRKNGSTDNRIQEFDRLGKMSTWTMIGVDSSGIFEAYIDSSQVVVEIVGYVESGSGFFLTNAQDVTPGTSLNWQDVDITSYIDGSDVPVGVVLEIISDPTGGGRWGARKNGSSDNRYDRASDHTFAIVGVDSSNIFEFNNRDSTDIQVFLLGYVTNGFVFNTNATDLSLSSTGSWTDLSSLPVGATGAIIEIISSDSFVEEFGLRKDGSVEAILAENPHTWALIESSSQIIEGYIEDTTVDFYLVGYTT